MPSEEIPSGTPSLKRQFTTLKQWKKKCTVFRQAVRALQDELNTGYDNIDAATETYHARLTARFERENKNEIELQIEQQRELFLPLTR